MFFRKVFFTIGIFCLFTAKSYGQAAKYLVLFKDKVGTPFTKEKPDAFLSKRSLDRRSRQSIVITEQDLPVNPAYVSQIRQTGAKVWYTTKWMNGVLVEASDAQLTAIKALSVVSGVEFNKSLAKARLSAEKQQTQKFGTEAIPDYGLTKTQNLMIGVDKMHDAGYHGEGMLIGIFDSGFLNSDKNTSLKPIFDEKRIAYTYDFVKRETGVYEDHFHGHNVFSLMASYQEGAAVGPAYKASFMLFRTEDDASETRLEEANWLFAAEMADSAGVDIISTSLGYADGHTDPTDDYKYSDMNGKTALISRAANWAAATGMVLVIAAGNEGQNPWKYISAPADAVNVLAVGAVNSTQLLAGFSSLGPSADNRIKPDVCAMGQGTVFSGPSNVVVSGSGTSYSTPLLAGMVAGFWQAQRHLTALDVLKVIRKAGHLSANPNNQYGNGIPTFDRALEIAKKEYPITSLSLSNDFADVKVSPNPFYNYLEINGLPRNKVFEVEMYDLIGRKILQKIINTNNSIVATNEALPVGIYLLKISDENGIHRNFRLLKN